jgi:hypothetical protein
MPLPVGVVLSPELLEVILVVFITLSGVLAAKNYFWTGVSKTIGLF